MNQYITLYIKDSDERPALMKVEVEPETLLAALLANDGFQPLLDKDHAERRNHPLIFIGGKVVLKEVMQLIIKQLGMAGVVKIPPKEDIWGWSTKFMLRMIIGMMQRETWEVYGSACQTCEDDGAVSFRVERLAAEPAPAEEGSADAASAADAA